MIYYVVINKYGYVHMWKHLYCIYHHGQAFILTLLPTAVFPQRFNFFTVCLVHYLREMPLLEFRYPDQA